MPLKDHLPEFVQRELEELRKAPVGVVVIFALGLGVGGYGTFRVVTWMYERELTTARSDTAFAEKRLKDLQEDLQGTRDETTSSGGGSSGVGALTSWGGGIPSTCDATLNREALAEYADKYDVALACAVSYTNVDKFTDTAISLSNKFTLTDPSSLRISIPASPAMTSALENWAGVEAMKRPPERRGTPLRVNLTVWYEVLLLPKDVLITDVKSLSDLRRLGGQVAEGDGRAVTAQNIEMSPKK
jgi:hypothetical protein